MVQENRDFEERQGERQGRDQSTIRAVETMRSAANESSSPAAGKDRISWFWQVFGGTILSIVALVIITAYSQITSTETDLRRDVTQIQSVLVKKDELNTRLSPLWSSIDKLQTTGTSLVGLNEQTKILNQQFDNQIKAGAEGCKELQKKIDDLSQRLQTLAERLAVVEAARKASKDGVRAAREP
jgi:hypothetical protein